MKLVMESPKLWKTCVGAASALVNEAAFVVSPEGLKMKAMDSSHIALVDIDLPAGAFEGFDVKKPATIGVNLSEMNRIVSRAKSDDELTIEFDENTNRLTLTLSGPPERRFNTRVIDVRKEDLPEPKLELTAAAEVVASAIQDGIKDAELVGDLVSIEASKDGIRMRAESDKGASELILNAGDEVLPKLDVSEPARAGYHVKQLGDMVKACVPADVIKMGLGTDQPIQLDCSIASGRLRFILAPRIEST